VSASSQSLAQGACEQSAAVERTSRSTELLSVLTRKNVDHSRSAAELMISTTGVVADANRFLEQMQLSMRDIEAASAEVAKITVVIDGIAFQTSLLALNAAVEAARAGEA